MSLIQTLVNVSERAARIARVIRQEPHLFSLLVEEKFGPEKNQRFTQDFKTLADVLIQETIRHYVSENFPMVSEYLQGEENSSFTNTMGETITVKVCENQGQTSELLSKVLNGDMEAANLLSLMVHEPQNNIEIDEELLAKTLNIDIENVGLWVDPIDSTGEYISGKSQQVHPITHAHQRGLECVTVLLGLYDRSSGIPIAGVVTQPFGYQTATGWKSHIYWGLKYGDATVHSSTLPALPAQNVNNYLVVSGSENPHIRESLQARFDILSATGAGYKCLVTAQNYAAAYVCAKNTTYNWDTAAPHGLLRALGGGIISFQSLINLGKQQLLTSNDALELHQIRYHQPDRRHTDNNKMWCNNEGIVAYRSAAFLGNIYLCMKEAYNS